MAKRKSRGKSQNLLQRIDINVVLSVILVALVSYFLFGFFQTEAEEPLFKPGAQFALPSAIVAHSDDPPIRQRLRALQMELRNTGYLSVRQELSLAYMRAVEQGLITATTDDINWLRALASFGKNLNVENPRAPETITIAVIQDRMLQPEKAIATYKEAIELLKTEEEASNRERYMAFCYDRLAEIQLVVDQKIDAISTYMEALENRSDNTFANRWYGKLIETQLLAKQYEDAKRACNSCIDDLLEETVPYNCLHSKAMLLAWFGHVEEAVSVAISNFDLLVQRQWRRDSDHQPCEGRHYPVTFDHFTDEQRAAVPGLVETPVVLPDTPFTQTICSDQQWPKYLERNSRGQYEVHEARRIYDDMHCITTKQKTPVMYTLEDVIVKGDGKIISSDKYCAVYTFGYPYQSTHLHPRLVGKNDFDLLSLPIVDVDEAIVLHSLLDENYYHFSIEGMAMPLLLQYADQDAWERSKVLIKAHSLTAGLLHHTGVPVPYLQRYDVDKARYRIKKLHVIDWKFLDTSVYHHPSEYYVPPAEVLTLMKYVYTANHASLNETVARNAVVYVHRDPSATRSYSNWKALAERLNSTASARGLDFAIHTGGESVSEQMAMFQRAVTVVGPHGAGLSNILFCEQHTAIVELISDPKSVSEYSRMSSALNLDYWTVPLAAIPRYDQGVHLSTSQIGAIARTVDYTLYDRGHRLVCGEDEPFDYQ